MVPKSDEIPKRIHYNNFKEGGPYAELKKKPVVVYRPPCACGAVSCNRTYDT
jgi:hypothetical protein